MTEIVRHRSQAYDTLRKRRHHKCRCYGTGHYTLYPTADLRHDTGPFAHEAVPLGVVRLAVSVPGVATQPVVSLYPMIVSLCNPKLSSVPETTRTAAYHKVPAQRAQRMLQTLYPIPLTCISILLLSYHEGRQCTP